eukprot:GILJ01003912.1.p1 GENE.GILJ01003912.1~~GILJ01003912.1.p1  ORF type:complete len:164 (-),score=20.61 GILJ01003912.1:200-649(-)
MLKWRWTVGSNIPPDAIACGVDGGELFVGRGDLSGKPIGKAGRHVPGLHVGFGGREHILREYEILVGMEGCEWVPVIASNIPANAIAAGKDQDGKPLYVARARIAATQTTQIGKAGRHFHGMMYGYGGAEEHAGEFEVLCASAPVENAS